MTTMQLERLCPACEVFHDHAESRQTGGQITAIGRKGDTVDAVAVVGVDACQFTIRMHC